MVSVEYEMFEITKRRCAAGRYVYETGSRKRAQGQRHRLGRHPHSCSEKGEWKTKIMVRSWEILTVKGPAEQQEPPEEV